MPRKIKFMPTMTENVKELLRNTESYSDEEILYFCRIIFSTFEVRRHLEGTENSEKFCIDIDGFVNEYNLLSEKEKIILSKYFGKENNTHYFLKEISTILIPHVSREYVRQIINGTLYYFSKRSCLFIKENDKSRETSIYALHLSERTSNTLFRGHINTVEKLRNCTENDILKISGVGKKTVEELRPYLRSVTNNSIYALNLPTRALNSLLRHGITTIDEFKKMSKEEILKIPSAGQKTAKVIIAKLEEIS